jgi:hypothetical protein
VFLTAESGRTWKALTRFRATVGATRRRELMTELWSTIENIGSSDRRSVAKFSVLLGPKHFRTYLAGLVEALETEGATQVPSGPWIDVVVERTPPETDGNLCQRRAAMDE